MKTNSQPSTTQKQNQNKLSKQSEQEQNHRNGDHMEGYQWGSDRGREEEKVQRMSSINGRQKIDRRRLRIAYEMEKPKNLYVQPIDMNQGGGMQVAGVVQGRGE